MSSYEQMSDFEKGKTVATISFNYLKDRNLPKLNNETRRKVAGEFYDVFCNVEAVLSSIKHGIPIELAQPDGSDEFENGVYAFLNELIGENRKVEA